jgi:hypothetical protein
MAKIEFDTIVRGMHGRLGDYVFRTSPSGKTIILQQVSLRGR